MSPGLEEQILRWVSVSAVAWLRENRNNGAIGVAPTATCRPLADCEVLVDTPILRLFPEFERVGRGIFLAFVRTLIAV